jgi:hypothetical protein
VAGGFAPAAVYADDEDDETDPTVQIITPVEGSSPPAGTITVEGAAFDESGIKVVKVKVDDGPYKTATPKAADGDWSTWSTTVDITETGSHRIVAKAYDKAGNYEWSQVPIDVVVDSDGTTTTSGNLPPQKKMMPPYRKLSER